jgi:hypothetical protein
VPQQRWFSSHRFLAQTAVFKQCHDGFFNAVVVVETILCELLTPVRHLNQEQSNSERRAAKPPLGASVEKARETFYLTSHETLDLLLLTVCCTQRDQRQYVKATCLKPTVTLGLGDMVWRSPATVRPAKDTLTYLCNCVRMMSAEARLNFGNNSFVTSSRRRRAGAALAWASREVLVGPAGEVANNACMNGEESGRDSRPGDSRLAALAACPSPPRNSDGDVKRSLLSVQRSFRLCTSLYSRMGH